MFKIICVHHVNVLENSISHNNRIETYWVKMVTAALMFQNMTRTFGDILLYRPAACIGPNTEEIAPNQDS
jgi:hypothetical protein